MPESVPVVALLAAAGAAGVDLPAQIDLDRLGDEQAVHEPDSGLGGTDAPCGGVGRILAALGGAYGEQIEEAADEEANGTSARLVSMCSQLSEPLNAGVR